MAERDDGDRAAVLAAHARFYAAVETGDLDALLEVWTDEEGSVSAHPGAAPIHGTPAVVRGWALVMASTDYIQFFLTDVEVTVSGDTAAVTCTENVLSADRAVATDTFRGGRGQALSVFKRSATGWRLWIHSSSPVGSDPL